MRVTARKSGLASELDGKPNNARLASLATYYDCVPGFERLLGRRAARPAAFLRRGRATLAKLPREQRRAQLCRPASPRSADAEISPYVSVK